MSPVKGVRGVKVGVGVLCDSSGGVGDSVQNLETPSAPYSTSQSILNKALSFQQETQQIALNRIF